MRTLPNAASATANPLFWKLEKCLKPRRDTAIRARACASNLTTGKFTVEPTFPRFNGLIGGTAFGYRVLWTKFGLNTELLLPGKQEWSSPRSTLGHRGRLFGPHPRFTTLWPTSWPQVLLIASAHVGGEIAHKMKYAGWDFIVS